MRSVPWCPQCDQYLAPPRVRADGTCPTCGVDRRPRRCAARAGARRPAADEPLDPLPWHFKLLLGAVALYLGYRALQGVEWLVGLF